MRKLFLFLLFVLLAQMSQAQVKLLSNGRFAVGGTCHDFDEISLIPDGNYLVKENGFYGIIGESGEEVTPIIYKNISVFPHSMYICLLDDSPLGAEDVYIKNNNFIEKLTGPFYVKGNSFYGSNFVSFAKKRGQDEDRNEDEKNTILFSNNGKRWLRFPELINYAWVEAADNPVKKEVEIQQERFGDFIVLNTELEEISRRTYDDAENGIVRKKTAYGNLISGLSGDTLHLNNSTEAFYAKNIEWVEHLNAYFISDNDGFFTLLDPTGISEFFGGNLVVNNKYSLVVENGGLYYEYNQSPENKWSGNFFNFEGFDLLEERENKPVFGKLSGDVVDLVFFSDSSIFEISLPVSDLMAKLPTKKTLNKTGRKFENKYGKEDYFYDPYEFTKDTLLYYDGFTLFKKDSVGGVIKGDYVLMASNLWRSIIPLSEDVFLVNKKYSIPNPLNFNNYLLLRNDYEREFLERDPPQVGVGVVANWDTLSRTGTIGSPVFLCEFDEKGEYQPTHMMSLELENMYLGDVLTKSATLPGYFFKYQDGIYFHSQNDLDLVRYKYITNKNGYTVCVDGEENNFDVFLNYSDKDYEGWNIKIPFLKK